MQLVREVGEGERNIEWNDDVRWGGMRSAGMKEMGKELERVRNERKICRLKLEGKII